MYSMNVIARKVEFAGEVWEGDVKFKEQLERDSADDSS